MERPPHCPHCGEIGTLETHSYGMFHNITKCSNCNKSDITDKTNSTLPDEQPEDISMNQQQYTAPPNGGYSTPNGGYGAPQGGYTPPPQNGYAPQGPQPAKQEKTLAPVRLFPAHPNAPDFVLASAVIGLDEFFGFVNANPQFLTEYQGKKQLKIQILRSKEGKLYSVVDEYKPQAQQPADNRQWGGYTTSPQAQPSQQQWGTQPPQQSQQGGYPQEAPNDLPF